MTLLIAISIGFYFRWSVSSPPSNPGKGSPGAANPRISQLQSPPVDLRELSQRLNPGAAPITEEHVRERQSLIASQVADATESLHDMNIEERVGGVEQLAAYPNRKSEKLLVSALEGDFESEVRKTAARSLAQIRHPKKATIDALLLALEDKNDDVAEQALETLIRYLQQLATDSLSARKVIAELQKKSISSHVSKATRTDIREFLSERK